MRTALLLAAISLLAACHAGASSDAADAAPTTTTSSLVTPGAAGADSSCALVTKQEAEAIFGEPLQELTVAANGMCEYKREADRGKKTAMPLAGMKLYPGETKAQFESETKNATGLMHEQLKPLGGFGEEAFEVEGFQIMALQHGKAISATHLLPMDRGKFQAFARKALSKL